MQVNYIKKIINQLKRVKHSRVWFLNYLSYLCARDVMGLINVRLNLLDDTILFLSREGFRLACLSHTGKVSLEGGGGVCFLETFTICSCFSLLQYS